VNANSFLIGTDPEFAILDGNSIVEVRDTLGHAGKLGWDHGGQVVELRPDPKFLASQLCVDIFRQLNRRELVPFRRYRWKAGGIAAGHPIGGHIHFDTSYDGESLTENDLRLGALDRMATWFEALELFPVGECEARVRQGYGLRGDIRPAGRRADGHARLEYRTPPSWLYNPRLAHLTLSAFKFALVDPRHTLDSLVTSSIDPRAKLRRFIRGFAESDDDAAELAPQLARRNGLEAFRGDPDDDIKTAWGIPAAPTEAEPATVETIAAPITTSPTTRYYDARIIEALHAQMDTFGH
jgi:hypothetical protein